MPSPTEQAHRLDAIARDLDLVVYRLERQPPNEPTALLAERRKLRRELDGLRERMLGVLRELG